MLKTFSWTHLRLNQQIYLWEKIESEMIYQLTFLHDFFSHENDKTRCSFTTHMLCEIFKEIFPPFVCSYFVTNSLRVFMIAVWCNLFHLWTLAQSCFIHTYAKNTACLFCCPVLNNFRQWFLDISHRGWAIILGPLHFLRSTLQFKAFLWKKLDYRWVSFRRRCEGPDFFSGSLC